MSDVKKWVTNMSDSNMIDLRLNGIDTIYGIAGIPVTDLMRLAQALAMMKLGRGERSHQDQVARRCPTKPSLIIERSMSTDMIPWMSVVRCLHGYCLLGRPNLKANRN